MEYDGKIIIDGLETIAIIVIVGLVVVGAILAYEAIKDGRHKRGGGGF